MLDFLLKILRVHPEQAGHLAHWTIALRGGIWPGWLILAAIVLCITVFTVYEYSGRHLSRLRRILLAGLRSLFLLLLLGILARPVLRLTSEGAIHSSMQMLVDVSQSMGIPDVRSEEADLKRAAIADQLLDPTRGLDQPLARADAKTVAHLPRMDLIRQVLKNPALGLLKHFAADNTIQPFTFGDAVHDLTADPTNAWVDDLKANEPATRLGDAVNEVLSRTRGQPSAGICIITDGQSNGGRSIVQAAEEARQQGVPLYIYGVGITQPKDIIVSNLLTTDVAFVNDVLPVGVRVRSPGYAGQTGTVVLTLDGNVVDSRDITYDASAEQIVPMRFTPTVKGTYTLKARIEPRPDEASKDNNEVSQPLKVLDGRIKVLYVEGQPRWEFKYLMAMLMRDRRVEFKAVLVDADASVTEGKDTPFLKSFPTDADGLTQYDLIILGDVDRNFFTGAQLDNIDHWVREGGGGLLSIAGRNFNPWMYADTKIADLLPIDISESGAASPPSSEGDHAIRLELTPAGAINQAMRLEDNELASAQAWTELPPIWWDAHIYRAKPGAQVLVVDPDPSRQNRYGKMPVFVLGQSGVGQVMYVGTDNTWRWRRNLGTQEYITLWGQIVQRLSLSHLLGGSKKTQLSTDQQKYTVGEKVTVMARLYDDSLRPIADAQVNAFYQAKGGQRYPLPLRMDGEQRGIYRGEFIAPAPGMYQCWAERDDKTRCDFSVTQSNVELDETALNEQGLREMAAASGGQFFREEDLYKLPAVVHGKTETIQRTDDLELWSTWFYFSLLAAVVTMEWVGRKISMMK